jgi:hypothetical protein
MGRTAYPDKGVMGLARHNSGGQVRLGLSATASSAVLYSAIVLFGVGSASPSALDVRGSDRRGSVLLMPGQADTVSGSVQRLPQASPEPGRNRPQVRPHRPRPVVAEATKAAAPPSAENKPAPVPTRGTESGPPSDDSSPPDPVAVPVPAPSVAIPPVPALELPLPLPLPALPALPALPPPPALPLPPLALPLDLPG